MRAPGTVGPGPHDLVHRLGPCEVHAPIEESPLRELTGPGRRKPDRVRRQIILLITGRLPWQKISAPSSTGVTARRLVDGNENIVHVLNAVADANPVDRVPLHGGKIARRR